jgi:hypothetical protein
VTGRNESAYEGLLSKFVEPNMTKGGTVDFQDIGVVDAPRFKDNTNNVSDATTTPRIYSLMYPVQYCFSEVEKHPQLAYKVHGKNVSQSLTSH